MKASTPGAQEQENGDGLLGIRREESVQGQRFLLAPGVVVEDRRGLMSGEHMLVKTTIQK